uniref:Uncharacterized protein n=1 Tax=Klebsiella pneumoniae TaxID=573 RepID=A0A2P1BNK8_KLEPN|nr:hypothetical protein [Klebsiella pneumoniae]
MHNQILNQTNGLNGFSQFPDTLNRVRDSANVQWRFNQRRQRHQFNLCCFKRLFQSRCFGRFDVFAGFDRCFALDSVTDIIDTSLD